MANQNHEPPRDPDENQQPDEAFGGLYFGDPAAGPQFGGRIEGDPFSMAEAIFGQAFEKIGPLMRLMTIELLDSLSAEDVAELQELAAKTYDGTAEVNKDGEFATDRKYYDLPAVMNVEEAGEKYRELLGEFQQGPSVDPALLGEAVEAYSTLGRTVVGIYHSPVDGTIENAADACILYLQSSGQISMRFEDFGGGPNADSPDANE